MKICALSGLFRSDLSDRQGKSERRALSRDALSANLAAVTTHDPGDGRQAEPHPREIRRGVQPTKRLEQLVGKAHVEADSIVHDFEQPASILRRMGRERDARSLHSGRGFPCILQQVREQRAHQPRIGKHHHPGLENSFDLTPTVMLPQVLRDLAGEAAQINRDGFAFLMEPVGTNRSSEHPHSDGGKALTPLTRALQSLCYTVDGRHQSRKQLLILSSPGAPPL